MPGFAEIVELLAQPRTDFDRDLGRVDDWIETLADREQELELAEIGLDRRLHVGILQLAGKVAAIDRACTMHLPERCSRRRVMLEFRELLLPVGAELGAHAPLDESPAHGRRLALQLHQLVGIFRRQRVGDGGEQLRHLHDGAFQPAECRRKFERVGGAIERHAEKARAGKSRGGAAQLRADFRVAPGTRCKAVPFTVVWGHRRAHPHYLISFGPKNKAYSRPSSSSMSRAITLRPPSQKFGSRASRPNGASNSA